LSTEHELFARILQVAIRIEKQEKFPELLIFFCVLPFFARRINTLSLQK